MLSVTAGRGPSEQQQQPPPPQQQQQQQPRLSGHPADVPMDLKKQALMQQGTSLEQPQDQDMADEDSLPRDGESDGVEDEDEEDGEDQDGFNVDADISTRNQQKQNAQPSPPPPPQQQQQQVQEILGQKIHDGGAVKYTVRWDNGDITEALVATTLST
ncbi:hypothetical protein DFQ26_009636 [Actinomortierella ambigua]|nr:hypothetical protein DFQ26_009636 [Actinomortierella ambigua]